MEENPFSSKLDDGMKLIHFQVKEESNQKSRPQNGHKDQCPQDKNGKTE